MNKKTKDKVETFAGLCVVLTFIQMFLAIWMPYLNLQFFLSGLLTFAVGFMTNEAAKKALEEE